MSKPVTAVASTIDVDGSYLTFASDGTIREGGDHHKRGDDVSKDNIAVTREGVRAVLKAAPLFAQMAEIDKKIRSIKVESEGEYGALEFTDSENDYGLCVKVGCTEVLPDQLAGYLKKLGMRGVK